MRGGSGIGNGMGRDVDRGLVKQGSQTTRIAANRARRSGPPLRMDMCEEGLLGKREVCWKNGGMGIGIGGLARCTDLLCGREGTVCRWIGWM